MGFEVPLPIYKLEFDQETRWNGLQVRMESAPIGLLFDVARLQETLSGLEGLERMECVERLISAVADCLISWNVERRGNPVPATLDGLRSQPMDMIMEIIAAWMKAVSEVPAPLVKPSTNGHTLGDLPMETMQSDLVS